MAVRASGRATRHTQSGAALLVVLLLVLIIGGSSASFIWFMNQQQARAGTRLRAAAALGAAEAGLHRTLSVLESASPDGRSAGRTWRPAAYSETLTVGAFEARFTISLADSPGGEILITSTGEAGGITRRLRARAHLASPALLAALYAVSFVRVEQPPAATFIVPYGAGLGDRPWIHVAAGREIWFATTDVSINDPAIPLGSGPGPSDAPDGPGSATAVGPPGPVRLLLARDAEVTLEESHRRVDLQQLRTLGTYLEGIVLRTETLPRLPVVDAVYYRSLATANIANAAANKAAGEYAGDADLALMRGSRYSPSQFEHLRAFLRTGQMPARLRGVVYVDGGVILEGEHLQVADGALITEGTVRVRDGASLEITHTAATRTLPGLVILEAGALIVSGESRLRVHGLVYASRVIDINDGARVDIVGGVLGKDAGLSFHNTASTVVIRYDPAVLGTPGLWVPAGAPVVAWIAAWEELP